MRLLVVLFFVVAIYALLLTGIRSGISLIRTANSKREKIAWILGLTHNLIFLLGLFIPANIYPIITGKHLLNDTAIFGILLLWSGIFGILLITYSKEYSRHYIQVWKGKSFIEGDLYKLGLINIKVSTLVKIIGIGFLIFSSVMLLFF